ESAVAILLVDGVNRARARGDTTAMHELSMRALKIFERSDPHGDVYGGLLLDLGVAAALEGKIDLAGGYADRALAVFEALGNPTNPSLVSVLELEGFVARERRDYVESERQLRRALVIGSRGRPSVAANTSIELSYTLVKAGRAQAAVQLL